MQLTDHFTLAEFACHNGVQVPESLIPRTRALAVALELLRAAANAKHGPITAPDGSKKERGVTIVSGYRDPEYNRKCGGAKSSRHMAGDASDIKVSGLTPEQSRELWLDLIKTGQVPQGGVGLYDGWLHVDLRGTAARWDNRKTGKRG